MFENSSYVYALILMVGIIIFVFEFYKDKLSWRKHVIRLFSFVIILSFIHFLLSFVLFKIT